MKKTILSLICVLALLAALLPAAMAATTVADADTDTGLDIVVIIDRSGSMTGKNGTDRNGIALAATNMLVDRCDAQNTSIAVIGYGVQIREDTGFVNLNDASAMETLKRKVTNLAVKGGDDTNTGLALEHAKKLIDRRKADHPDHTFGIIVLSDGKIDFQARCADSKALAQQRNMTYDELIQDSRDTATQVANACAADDITISCLGIYPGNDKSKLGTDMQNWAVITNGTYRETNSISDAYEYIREFYLNISNGEDPVDIGDDGVFRIDPGVAEANIEIIPGIASSKIVLHQKDADGNWQPYVLNASDIREAQQYTIVKMIRPDEGDYRLTFTDGEMHNFDVHVTYNRDLVMRLDAPRSMRNQETTNEIKLDVYRQGIPYYDANGAQPTIQVSDQDGQIIDVLQMTWDDSQSKYSTSFSPQRMGIYRMRATLELNGLQNVSNIAEINVGKASVTVANQLGNIAFTGHALTKYDADSAASPGYDPYVIRDVLSQYFADPDSVGITRFEAVLKNSADSQYVKIEQDAAAETIAITPLKATMNPVVLEIYAYGADGSVSPACTGSIVVQDLQADVEVNRNETAELEANGYEIKGLLPRKEPDIVIENVNICFNEPNFQTDGEGFRVEVIEAHSDPVAYGVEAETRKIEAVLDGSRLLITGLSEGDAAVTLRARSYDTSEASFSFNVHVVNMLKIYLLIGGGILLAIILLAVLIAMIADKNKPRFRKNAVLGVRLLNEDEEEEGSCILLRYGKGPAKMTDLCVKCGISTSGMRKLLDNVRLYPRKSSSIEIRYKLNGKGATSTLAHNESKDIPLDADGDRVLTLTYIEEGVDDYD